MCFQCFVEKCTGYSGDPEDGGWCSQFYLCGIQKDFITRKMLSLERLIHQANEEGEVKGEDIPDRSSYSSKGVNCIVFKYTMCLFIVTMCFWRNPACAIKLRCSSWGSSGNFFFFKKILSRLSLNATFYSKHNLQVHTQQCTQRLSKFLIQLVLHEESPTMLVIMAPQDAVNSLSDSTYRYTEELILFPIHTDVLMLYLALITTLP